MRLRWLNERPKPAARTGDLREGPAQLRHVPATSAKVRRSSATCQRPPRRSVAAPPRPGDLREGPAQLRHVPATSTNVARCFAFRRRPLATSALEPLPARSYRRTTVNYNQLA